MKKYFILSAAALALASCSNDEFLGEGTGQSPSSTSSSVIGFGTYRGKTTRAVGDNAADAAKLNNKFIVYGHKYYSTEPFVAGTSTGQVGDPASQQTVFDKYEVKYELGSDNTTESNTTGWEYVDGANQTIKYWDYGADGYVFSAVTGTDITYEKIESAADGSALSWSVPTLTVDGTASKYDKGWVVTVPAGGSIADLYASDRVPVAKAEYQNEVTLTFYSMVTKIRFGIYETVPGYSVHIDKFYYTDNSVSTPVDKDSETNFGISGNFSTLGSGDTELIVTYYDNTTSSLHNHPKVTPGTGAAKGNGLFGTNIQAQTALTTASNNATYDQAGGDYTLILPGNGGALDLKVDYTLTSTDGSGEKIVVSGATAKVPSNFTQWKANFAYTYLFKISDNTNGSSGTWDDDDDPSTPEVPVVGLYPITFDACVVDAQEGIQETITSIADKSITTYQKGEIVTKNDEYVAYTTPGTEIYFEDEDLDISTFHVYEVNNYGTEPTTEEVVANYKNNFCVLTEVDVKPAPGGGTGVAADFIPLADGTSIQKKENEAAYFKPEAGKTYAIVKGDASSLDPTLAAALVKVVKVQGSASATFNAHTDAFTGSVAAANITKLTGDGSTATLYLSEVLQYNDPATGTGVQGAIPGISVTGGTNNKALAFAETATAGVYTISVDQNAINTGTANGTYTVSYQGASVTITVNISTALYQSDGSTAFGATAAVTAGATGEIAILKIADAVSNAGAIVNANEDKGLHVTNANDASGEYTISADADATPGVYTIKIAGQSVDVTVTNYAFAAASYEYNMLSTGALLETTKVALNQTDGATTSAATSVNASALNVPSGITFADQTPADGTYTVTATAGGEYTVTYPNTAATTTVKVNQYTLETTSATIARSTGSLDLTVKVNGEVVTPKAVRVKITKGTGATPTDVTGKFNITANGNKIVIKGAQSDLTADTDYTIRYYLEGTKTNEVATSALTVN